MEPVILDETVTDAPGEVRLGEFLDRGDLGPARGDKEPEEVHTTQIAGGRGRGSVCVWHVGEWALYMCDM